MNTAKEFWSYVAKGRKNECWRWLGACNNSGYGTLVWRGQTVVAHRVAAYLSSMRVRPHSGRRRTDPVVRRNVLHMCDTPVCCNPDHLEIGGHGKNQRDAYRRGRRSQPQGAAHANAKLTTKQAHVIRSRYIPGVIRQVDLATEFGVSQRVISLIVRGETYR